MSKTLFLIKNKILECDELEDPHYWSLMNRASAACGLAVDKWVTLKTPEGHAPGWKMFENACEARLYLESLIPAVAKPKYTDREKQTYRVLIRLGNGLALSDSEKEEARRICKDLNLTALELVELSIKLSERT
jgi:hypothetical protein